ncbi:hypothetical protein G9A89_012439 [Geosiphon pyriformis]|nr:hypothetical protein G9A89_012439 [Geosiphon pyriformis]
MITFHKYLLTKNIIAQNFNDDDDDDGNLSQLILKPIQLVASQLVPVSKPELDDLGKYAKIAKEAFCYRKQIMFRKKGIWQRLHISNNELIISFGGNEDELSDDLEASNNDNMVGFPDPKILSGAKISKRFYNNYLLWSDKYYSSVSNFINNTNLPKITITGFGSGGVYAQLLALSLKLDLNSKRISWPLVITFGQPRIGNKEFANLVEHKTTPYRVINQHDDIPREPKGDYVHGGLEIWCSGVEGPVFYCPLRRKDGIIIGENEVN